VGYAVLDAYGLFGKLSRGCDGKDTWLLRFRASEMEKLTFTCARASLWTEALFP
jgi:hypothetical protein